MMTANEELYRVQEVHPEPATLAESPLWSGAEQCLYYVDIPEHQVLRFDPASGGLKRWQLDSEPGCIALIEGGGLLVAQRNGLWTLDPASGAHAQVAAAPFDSSRQRFNDGKPDPQGRLWVGTIDDARAPASALYRWADGAFSRMADGITTSNGVSWSPDGRRMYWSDTKAHEIYSFDFDPAGGTLGERRLFARFDPPGGSAEYGGRPDGAAVDVDGYYWVAMFEGQRLLRLAPDGAIDRELRLPLAKPTMPAFGGSDLRTLYIAAAGGMLKVRVQTPGLPANIARL